MFGGQGCAYGPETDCEYVVPIERAEAAEARVKALTEAPSKAADDLGKATNQFAGLLPDGRNQHIFARKEAEARAVWRGSSANE